jgi:hypothetical protein
VSDAGWKFRLTGSAAIIEVDLDHADDTIHHESSVARTLNGVVGRSGQWTRHDPEQRAN